MSPPRPSPEGADDAFPDGPEPYRSNGPFLVVHADDPAAAGVADGVVKACADHGVAVDKRMINAVSTVRIDRYPMLVLVLPTVPRTPASEHLRMFVDLICQFRAMRPHGLHDLLDRRCRWHEAGVIHVAGRRGVLHHRTIEPALLRYGVCIVHHVDEAGRKPVDVFDCFAAPPAPPRKRTPVAKGEEIQRAMTLIQEWGAEVRHVPALLACLEQSRTHYENVRFPALYRPVSSLPHNRLSFILDGVPHEPTPQQRKTWTENGARVTRETIKRMQTVVPTLHRPGGSTKGAQADLRSFALHLLVVNAYLRLPPEQDRPAP